MSAVPAARPLPATRFLTVLTWAVVLMSSARLIAYLPALQAISASADAAEHSLLTWLVWTGSNASMAMWLYERNARRISIIIALNIGNALLCTLTTVLVIVRQLSI